ncbi:hypothetical protein HRbin11_00149 [bacterium HR11]|nr:hypothetical protein HRbin11_00149 [bacterium HR11]
MRLWIRVGDARFWHRITLGVTLLIALSSALVLGLTFQSWRARARSSQAIALEIDDSAYTVAAVVESIRRFVPNEILSAESVTDTWLIRHYLEDFLMIELARKESSRNTQGVSPRKLETHVLNRTVPPDPALKQDAQALIALNYAFYRDNPDSIQVSPEDIQAYYETHREAFRRGDRVLLAQLGFAEAGEAQQAYQQIQVIPELFDHYVYLASSGQGGFQVPTGFQQGYVGIVELEDLPAEVRSLVRQTPPGKCAPPIQIGNVYVILKVLDRRPAGIAPLEEVSEEIRLRIMEDRFHQRVQHWVAQVFRRHRIKVYWSRLRVAPDEVRRRWLSDAVFASLAVKDS